MPPEPQAGAAVAVGAAEDEWDFSYPSNLNLQEQTMVNRTFSGVGMGFLFVLAGMALVGGCESTATSPPTLQSAQTPEQAPGAPGVGQEVFASDNEALNAL